VMALANFFWSNIARRGVLTQQNPLATLADLSGYL
jgi:hypothetical protein